MFSNKKISGSIILLLVVFAISFFLLDHSSENSTSLSKAEVGNIKYVNVGGTEVKVELAKDEATQTKGLSGKSGLAEDEGMLFIFDRPAKHYFWMKDMNFAVDIIWLDGDRNIIYIKKDAKPDALLPSFGPDEDSSYVLEVVAGFAEKYNLKEGDKVEFGF